MFKFKKNKYPDQDNPLAPIAEKIADLLGKIKTRCLLEGCRYGIEHVEEKPLDHCIYCGDPAMPPPNDFWDEESLNLKPTRAVRVYYAWTSVGIVGGKKPNENQIYCAWCNRSQAEIKANGEKLNDHIQKHTNEDQKVKLELLDELIAHFDKNHEYHNRIGFNYKYAISVLHGWKSMVKRGIR